MRHRLSVSFLAGIAVVLLVSTSSCYRVTYADDPVAATPGYRLFTGSNNKLRFKFEYPETWERVSGGLEGLSTSVYIIPNDYAQMMIRTHTTCANGPDSANAQQFIERLLYVSSKLSGFQIVSRGSASLGQAGGEEAIYSYRYEKDTCFVPAYSLRNRLVIERDLSVDYRGQVYSVILIVGFDKYVNVKEGYEHLIATFRFLD